MQEIKYSMLKISRGRTTRSVETKPMPVSEGTYCTCKHSMFFFFAYVAIGHIILSLVACIFVHRKYDGYNSAQAPSLHFANHNEYTVTRWTLHHEDSQ